MRLGMLGQVGILDADGNGIDVGGRQPRLLLALLLVAGGRPVAADALIDGIWGDHPPMSAPGSLQSYISRLRRVLEPLGANLRFDEAGYTLDVGRLEVDALRFEELAERGRALLLAGEAAAARTALVEAEALWRGPLALPEIRELDVALGTATRLDERRLTAIEDRLTADLALGRHEVAIGELSALVGTHPLREGLQAKLALALYRSGRQAEALRSLAKAASALRDGLGIDPGRALRELELAVLAQDPALDLVGPSSAGAGGAATVPPTTMPPTLPTTTPAQHDAAASTASAALPIVGREDVLSGLLAAWQEAMTGPARFAVVEGEPGIGKTHLAEAVRAAVRATGAEAPWGRCDEGGAAPALWPWLGPLRSLADGLDVDPELARVLSAEQTLDAVVPPSNAGRFALMSAMADLLDRAAERRPVLVLIDDLQWADDTSLELLAFLAGRRGKRWMVLVTMRELEVGRNDLLVGALATMARRAGTRRIHLHGLGAEDTAAMLASVADVDRAAADAVHRRAEGNPFYAIELARLHVDGDRAVPAGVGDVIRRRIARLPTATADLLSVAAVAGRQVDLPFLAQCAEVDLGAVLDHLDPAVAHRLLVADPERPSVLRFNHALVREVLLDDLTALRRARLHLRVADAMEHAGEIGIDDAEIHAEHLWRAAPAGAGRRAADALDRAADVAVRRLSFAAAESHLRRVVQLRRSGGSSDEDLRAQLRAVERLLSVIATTRYYQGADDELIALAQQLARRLGEDDLSRQLLWYQASALLVSTRRNDAAPLVVELRDLTRSDPRPWVRAIGHEKTAICLWNEGRITEAVMEIDQAASLFESAPDAHDPLVIEQRGETLLFWLMLHALGGDVAADEIVAQFDAAIAHAPNGATSSAISGFAATTAGVLGRWDDVERFASVVTDDERSSQFAFWDGQLRMLRGVRLALDGACDEAITMFVEGRDRYVGVRGRSSIVTVQSNLAIHLAQHGWLDQARAMVTEARAELETYDERWNEPTLIAAEASISAAAGEPERASTLLARAIDLAEQQGALGLAGRLTRLSLGGPLD